VLVLAFLPPADSNGKLLEQQVIGRPWWRWKLVGPQAEEQAEQLPAWGTEKSVNSVNRMLGAVQRETTSEEERAVESETIAAIARANAFEMTKELAQVRLSKPGKARSSRGVLAEEQLVGPEKEEQANRLKASVQATDKGPP
jgi:hypothetical protein